MNVVDFKLSRVTNTANKMMEVYRECTRDGKTSAAGVNGLISALMTCGPHERKAAMAEFERMALKELGEEMVGE